MPTTDAVLFRKTFDALGPVRARNRWNDPASARAGSGGEGRGNHTAMHFSPRPLCPEAVEALVVALELPAPQPGSDWTLDAADADRITEFCEFYDLADLSDDEKYALMGVIVASLDDRLLADPAGPGEEECAAGVARLLRRDFALHAHTVETWCRHDADGADGDWVFCVTPMMRRIWSECGPRASS